MQIVLNKKKKKLLKWTDSQTPNQIPSNQTPTVTWLKTRTAEQMTS